MHPRAAVRRLAARAGAGVRGTFVDLGLLPYRPTVWSETRWDSAYGGGSLDYFEQLDELARYSVLAGYLQFLGGQPDVLDVGCGTGLLRRRLHDASFSTYTGIDPTPAAIEAAVAAGPDDGRTRYLVGDTGSAELGTYDAILCNEVLAMVPDAGALLDDMHRLLVPGGHLLVSLWRHPGERAVWRQVHGRFEELDRVEVRNPRNRLGPGGWRVSLHRRS